MLLLALFIGVLLFRGFVFERIVVSGSSMCDTLENGDVVLSRKYDAKPIKRFDIVVVKHGSVSLVKRVIGLPNESLMISGGIVFVDGAALGGDYGALITDGGIIDGVILHLRSDEFFLLGDNRNHSEDSRAFGAVGADSITGVVVFRVFPFWQMGSLGATVKD